jgi:hypothetical protein
MRFAAAVAVVGVIAVGGCVSPPAAPPPQPWDGLYSGDVIATPVRNGPAGNSNAICPNRWPKRDMIVANNYVNFGEFQGPINANGTAVLTAGNDQINGRFTVGGFAGDLVNPPPGCAYHAALTRTQ